MFGKVYAAHELVCSNCGFATRDIALLSRHSCDVQENNGRCEDFPCCGHELGDCNGQLYGSTEAIRSDAHLLCDHEMGECRVWEEQDMLEDAEYSGDYW